MMNCYGMQKGERIPQSLEQITKGCWINLENPSDKEIEQVSAATGVSEEMLKAALDEEERARIEIEDGNSLILMDIPIINDESEWYIYSTLPLAVIINEDYFLTVCLRDTTVLTDFLKGRIKEFDINKRTRFLYQIMYLNAIKFLHHLKQIDRTSNRVQQSLHRSMKNKELIQLLDLEKALVYFSTSLNANQIVIDRLRSLATIRHYEDDNEILDDVIIENKQAIEMATVYRDILSGTMDAFASVISNNQNIVMKFLTAITICLTIPTVISSLWGMNVPVPFAENPFGFLIIVIATVAVIVPVIILMIKKKMF